MSNEEYQKLEDLIIKANQSGKKETSALVHDILHRIEPIIATSIEKNVNGKINKLTTKFDEYVLLDVKWKEEDMEWKGNYEPFLKGVKAISTSGKIFIWIVITVGALATAYVAIKKLFI